MGIKYIKIQKRPNTFHRLFGVSVEQFETILRKVEPLWQERVLGRYKRPGRYHKLEVSDMVLMLLLYYRNLHNPSVYRISVWP